MSDLIVVESSSNPEKQNKMKLIFDAAEVGKLCFVPIQATHPSGLRITYTARGCLKKLEK